VDSTRVVIVPEEEEVVRDVQVVTDAVVAMADDVVVIRAEEGTDLLEVIKDR
jgi:hypothetical protein